ncbi:MAG: hypothetical protein WBA38_06730, partial [Gordonia sp. (in: high G+C Gram-positive bacteria)]|uniref:hypothetical protein n=1 Tax=Gordonia sp. (in: high G+C Gram-positive bacteria) TaxID=84139 RepID=UPI003C7216EF
TATPTAIAACDAGLTTLAEYQIPITADSPIVTLHHTMAANGRPWDSMTLWLEAHDGTFITTYQ